MEHGEKSFARKPANLSSAVVAWLAGVGIYRLSQQLMESWLKVPTAG